MSKKEKDIFPDIEAELCQSEIFNRDSFSLFKQITKSQIEVRIEILWLLWRVHTNQRLFEKKNSRCGGVFKQRSQSIVFLFPSWHDELRCVFSFPAWGERSWLCCWAACHLQLFIEPLTVCSWLLHTPFNFTVAELLSDIMEPLYWDKRSNTDWRLLKLLRFKAFEKKLNDSYY